jgi:hypothetical protein
MMKATEQVLVPLQRAGASCGASLFHWGKNLIKCNNYAQHCACMRSSRAPNHSWPNSFPKERGLHCPVGLSGVSLDPCQWCAWLIELKLCPAGCLKMAAGSITTMYCGQGLHTMARPGMHLQMHWDILVIAPLLSLPWMVQSIMKVDTLHQSYL